MSVLKNTKITTDIETITPKQAQLWLSKNTKNRNVSPRTVEYYQRMIKDGKWQVNGESIKIADNGTLLDGQHRLEAISKANVPVQTAVTRGLPVSTFLTLDAGRCRSPGDYLKINGCSGNTKILAAAARVAMYFDKNTGKFFSHKNKIAPYEVVEFVEKNKGLFNIMEFHDQMKEITSSSLFGGCIYVFGQIDREATDSFFNSLRTGANLKVGSPVLTLRNRLIAVRKEGRAGSAYQRLIISYFVSAFNAYRAGRKMANMSYSADRDIAIEGYKRVKK